MIITVKVLFTCFMSLSSLVENSLFNVSHAIAIISRLDCIAYFNGLIHSV